MKFILGCAFLIFSMTAQAEETQTLSQRFNFFIKHKTLKAFPNLLNK